MKIMKQYICNYCGYVFTEYDDFRPKINYILKNWRTHSFKDILVALYIFMNSPVGTKNICPNCRSNNVNLTEK